MLTYFKAYLASKGISVSEKGQGLIEYAILVILIALIAWAAVGGFTNKLNTLYNSVKISQ
jgi:Flp pilus assembly pilin Flp